MKPSKLPLLPQTHTPFLTLPQLLTHPTLQKRVNSPEYELSGIHNLIVQLKKETIQQLKEEFINNQNNVNLHQFMWLIENSVVGVRGWRDRRDRDRVGDRVGERGNEDKEKERERQRQRERERIEEEVWEYQVKYEIVRVFEQIDIDNSNSICWQQYIQYITSSSLMQLNQDQPKSPESSNPTNPTPKHLQFSHKQKTQFRKNPIRKIIEIQKLGMLAIVQKKSDTLTFLGIGGGTLGKPYTLHGIDHGRVLSIDYSQEERMFGVLMGSHLVVFVEDGDMPKVRVDNQFMGNQIDIMYLRKHRLWLLISLDNTIQIFPSQKSQKKSPQPQPHPITTLKPHSQQLIGIRQLLNPLSIISASWSGSIKIWSLTLNQLLIDLNPVKQDDFSQCKSIKGFEVFNFRFISYIICWMFSSQISVWLPSSSLTKPYMGKLKGHVGIVQEAKFLSKFPIVVSIDNKNSVRVWDIAKMQCIQSWKMESTFHAKLHVLRSVPYVLFYDKLIEFYKSTKQASLIQFNKQKRSTSNYPATNFPKQKQQKQRRHESIIIENTPNKMMNIESAQQLKKTLNKDPTNLLSMHMGTNSSSNPNSNHSLNPNNPNSNLNLSPNVNMNVNSNVNVHEQSDFDFSTNSLKFQERSNLVLAILYDDYFGCFLVLTSEAISVIGANTGNLITKAYVENRNDSFVTMCMKENRRFFVANSQGEVICFKTEDCSILYKIYPLKDLSTHSKDTQPQPQTPQKPPKPLEYTIHSIDFNTYNKILLTLSQSDTDLLLTTYENFSSFEPSKKKQIVVNQVNICSFVSAQKFGVFYVGSNQPEVVSIWDYHNFIVLRTVEMPNFVVGVSGDQRFNFLVVCENAGIRVLRVLPVDARNNTRASDSNLVVSELYIKSPKRVQRCQIIYHKNQPQKHPQKKTKVTFQQNSKPPQQQNPRQNRIQIYAYSNSMISIISVGEYLDQIPLITQPIHSQKPNITKQLKRMTLSPQLCPHPQVIIDAASVTKAYINGGKRNINFLGKIGNMVYFQTKEGVLHFYKPEEAKIWGKLSMPKCEVIQWRIFYDLASKVLSRMKKAEKISKEIFAFKRHEKSDKHKLDYLRLAFLLNKYFTEDDISQLREYFTNNVNTETNKKGIRTAAKQQNESLSVPKKKQEPQNKGGSSSYFDKKYQQRVYNRNQTAQKLKTIQKKYNQAFSYIRSRHQNLQQKHRSSSLNKLAPSSISGTGTGTGPGQDKKRNSITSSVSPVFKIKTTVSSANKMYFQHTKEIKSYLHKIGIINSKTAGLKL